MTATSLAYPYPDVHDSDPTSVASGLTLSSTYKDMGSVIAVDNHRTITILLKWHPGGSGEKLSILPLIAVTSSAPARSDDSWYAPAVWDGTVSANILGSTINSDASFTQNPEWGQIELKPTEIVSIAANGSGDEVRMAVRIDVTEARHFAADIADTANGSGTVDIDIVRSG